MVVESGILVGQNGVQVDYKILDQIESFSLIMVSFLIEIHGT